MSDNGAEGDDDDAAALGPRPGEDGGDRPAEGTGPRVEDTGPSVENTRPRPDPGAESGGEDGGSALLNDLLSSIVAVLGIGLLLFAVSGVWPPMVAIESPSMEPNINTGDLVFVMEEHRFAGPDATGETGVVTADSARASGYEAFDRPGDVIIYEPNGETRRVPVIHRAMFWVNESENWYGKAQSQYLPSGVGGCEDLEYCPAPNSGFITLGDNNRQYDQLGGNGARTGPVRPEWVIGTAEFRMPGLGWLKLRSSA